MLAITPDQFQTIALAWVAALVAVGAGISLAIPKLTGLFNQVTELMHRVNRQSDRIDSQQLQITQVALNTPAPAKEPAKVEVTNTISEESK